MTPEQRAQMQRLARFRESARIAREQAAQASAQEDGESGNDDKEKARSNQLQDPLIYAGVYAPSGFDMMSILIRVRVRPDPKIDLGLIDDRCALLVCDLQQPDIPIVYCSEPFSLLTGYQPSEILGKNCRFLQSPDGNVSKGEKRLHTNDRKVYELKTRINKREEAQVTITNYKKGGESFENILTTIPIRWDSASEEVRYVVGFQVDRRDCFVGPALAPVPARK